MGESLLHALGRVGVCSDRPAGGVRFLQLLGGRPLEPEDVFRELELALDCDLRNAQARRAEPAFPTPSQLDRLARLRRDHLDAGRELGSSSGVPVSSGNVP